MLSAQYRESSRGVTLYRDLDFSGASQTFSDGYSDLRRSFVGNDTVTSVRIDPGCRATLFTEAHYSGTYIEVDRDIADLRDTAVGNDSVTSLHVRCEGDGPGSIEGSDWSHDGDDQWDVDSADYGITLFRDLDFSGAHQTFTADVSDLRGSIVGNDTVTSVRVTRECRARLYSDSEFRGAYLEVDRDASDLRGSPIGNDTVSSLQVRCEGDGEGWSGSESGSGPSDRVTLYEDTDFQGSAFSFDSDVGDLRSAFGANDEASSVRVAPGCTVRLYPDPQFRGSYTETNSDISDLRGSRVGNDSISSLQVRCR